MMVSQHSATYSGSNEQSYDQIALQSDHSEMVKFTDFDNPDYLVVEGRIKGLVLKAPEVIKSRFRGMRSAYK